MARNVVDIDVELEGFAEMLEELERMEDSIDARWLKNRQAYYARKHFVDAMRRGSHSVRLESMISVTTAKKRAGKYGVKVGVVKNDPAQFPEFSAPALASVIEYGTAERYRTLRTAGLITGRVSTGEMPAAPWLRPAWDANVKSTISDVEDAIFKRVLDE